LIINKINIEDDNKVKVPLKNYDYILIIYVSAWMIYVACALVSRTPLCLCLTLKINNCSGLCANLRYKWAYNMSVIIILLAQFLYTFFFQYFFFFNFCYSMVFIIIFYVIIIIIDFFFFFPHSLTMVYPPKCVLLATKKFTTGSNLKR
jgi:hypothetical protein